VGNVDTAFKNAAKVVSMSFAYPHNGHNPIGPACCVADVRKNSTGAVTGATVYSNTQNVPNLTTEIANSVLKIEPKFVRVLWHEGSSTFGNGYHAFDIAEAAVVMSRAANAPVRLQLMRWDEQGWTRYGPAITVEPLDVVATNGDLVQLEVAATGSAPLGYQWWRDETNLVTGASGPVLELAGITAAQAGTYAVVVSNAVGNVRSRAAHVQLAS
jgi:nicotinate dehydrogenase subunit B